MGSERKENESVSRAAQQLAKRSVQVRRKTWGEHEFNRRMRHLRLEQLRKAKTDFDESELLKIGG